jgi:hypothetical protein
LISHSTFRDCRTIVAGGFATALAALAFAAPVGAAEVSLAASGYMTAPDAQDRWIVPDAPDRWVVPDAPDRMNIPDNVLPAVQHVGFRSTGPGD